MRALLLLLFFCFTTTQAQQEIFKKTLKLMGSRFEITVVAKNQNEADQYIEKAIAEISRIEKLISSWDPESQTSAINRKAGIAAVAVDQELFDLISRSLALSKLTNGAFDISFASMDRVWKFDGSMTVKPSDSIIREAISKVGYRQIVLDSITQSVFLKTSGMKIGFGAIGKGYAADRAAALLQSEGVTAGIINASGDMTSWGTQPDGTEWKVAITNPLNKENAFAILPIKNGAVVTSGDYEKFVTFDGVRYSHIIDPRTGYPATGIISATVFAPKAELADALATSIFVMGIETGLDFINQLPQVECILIDVHGNVFTSTHISLETK